jgi:hypothetical protein
MRKLTMPWPDRTEDAPGSPRARSFLIEARMRFNQRTLISLYTIEIEQDSRFGRCVGCGVDVIQSEAILL